jgi:hypothetical protein
MTTQDKIESLSKQIVEIEKQLSLIEEEKSTHIDVPLDLLNTERKKKEQLKELVDKKAELEKQLAQELIIPSEKKPNVYISSTSEDLKDYRAVARAAVAEAKCNPVMKENFGPNSEYSVAACKKQLRECDLVIFLVAFQLSYVPAQNQGGTGMDSITALEWKYAQEDPKKDVLIFLSNENEHWSKGTDKEEINNFRSLLGTPDGFFEYEESADSDATAPTKFRKLVLTALASYKEKKQSTASTVGADSLEFRGASARVLSRNFIPFLGPGVYGHGPLSVCALRKALDDESCQSCDNLQESCQKSSLATVAEFYFLSADRNDLLLPKLKQIFDKQAQTVQVPPIYDLVKQIKPPLIVSTTLDLLLERTLWDGGKQRCLILCHAIRTHGKKKGILIFDGPQDNSPDCQPADGITAINLDEEWKKPIEQRAYIVYKPLGSPLLPSNEYDTVVITEEDYQVLLTLLGSKESGVPAAFTTCFLNCPPIFLGYPMDVWHYRLMGQFFKSISVTEKGKFAVSLAKLPLEQKAWNSLGVKLVSMDLSVFSQQVKKNFPKDGVSP